MSDVFDNINRVWVHTNTTVFKQRTSTATTSAISQKSLFDSTTKTIPSLFLVTVAGQVHRSCPQKYNQDFIPQFCLFGLDFLNGITHNVTITVAQMHYKC